MAQPLDSFIGSQYNLHFIFAIGNAALVAILGATWDIVRPYTVLSYKRPCYIATQLYKWYCRVHIYAYIYSFCLRMQHTFVGVKPIYTPERVRNRSNHKHRPPRSLPQWFHSRNIMEVKFLHGNNKRLNPRRWVILSTGTKVSFGG